jgi:hypothetical protein
LKAGLRLVTIFTMAAAAAVALRWIARLAGMALVLLFAAAGVAEGFRAAGFGEVGASILGWAAGVVAAVAAVALVRKLGRLRRAAALERDRAEGDRVRREEPARYRDLLRDATEALAFTDPDAYVGGRVGGARPEPPPVGPVDELAPANAAAVATKPGWVQWLAFLGLGIAMFVVFPLVFSIRSATDAAVAVPLAGAWIWCWKAGIDRGWWEGGE